ncbi:MBL fold metallo-hydrolase [Gelidibacter mesophilus]|uniref:MBL fold metallo-hydrolase n=1 Tax=Gelidibacter mesophilus TaxID=169050 RepID=UPI000424876C|nr:MBL fold metallo-hydrolase [Gelidibacter mesophilus]
MTTFKIFRFVNPYKNANTYVVQIDEHDVLIIDLGNYPTTEFVNWLKHHNKNIVGLILTHEHADHCYGVDALKDYYDFNLYCSEACAINMRDPKQNYSRYIEEFETFAVKSKAIIVKDNDMLNFSGFQLRVMETPGHSPGSICLFFENGVFTGDTILNNVKTPLSFPHSNKLDYKKSKKIIMENLQSHTTIYPGHDASFLDNSFIK